MRQTKKGQSNLLARCAEELRSVKVVSFVFYDEGTKNLVWFLVLCFCFVIVVFFCFLFQKKSSQNSRCSMGRTLGRIIGYFLSRSDKYS